MINGIINIYKEAGFTSHDVVAKMRGILKQKKIGHTGTLDPDAVGVLPVCLGNATRVCDLLTEKEKEYEAVLLLGIVTDTQDTSGQVLEEKPVLCDEQTVRNTIMSFQGEYKQVPPMYSALKVDGKRLYELARQGKEVERKARPVIIHRIEIGKMELPRITLRVSCSKGTYIRTLCHDIGQALGCGGVMEHLKRTRSGEFTLDTAITLKQLEALRDEERVSECVIPTENVFGDLKRVKVKQQFTKLVDNGNLFEPYQAESIQPADGGEAAKVRDGEQVRVYNSRGIFYGIYRYEAAEQKFKPVKMFFSE